jgi:hypothetical protein
MAGREVDVAGGVYYRSRKEIFTKLERPDTMAILFG